MLKLPWEFVYGLTTRSQLMKARFLIIVIISFPFINLLLSSKVLKIGFILFEIIQNRLLIMIKM